MPAELDQPIEESTTVSSAEAASLKKKQVIVAVLLVGLLIAILTQPKSDNGDTTAVLETRSAGKTAAVSPPAEPVESEESRIDRLSQVRELKRFDFREISSLELFVPEPKRLQRNRETVTNHVDAIYGSSSDRSALVGQMIVRQGQPLPDGSKVLQVNQDGIHVGL